jgi:plastocyanin
MNVDKLIKLLASMALAALVGFGAMGLAGCQKSPAPAPEPAPAAEAAPAPAAPAPAGAVRILEMKVTEKGYEPSPLTLKKGEPVKLKITRVTDHTCATEIILKDGAVDIEKALPLNETVEVEFTPEKTGQLKYGCAMGMMIAGVFVVE